jgi:hypothetical protein
MGFLGRLIKLASKWDIKKKNNEYWQITPTPEDDMLWPCAMILIVLFIYLKYPVVFQIVQEFINKIF